jgi:hypothetical protein
MTTNNINRTCNVNNGCNNDLSAAEVWIMINSEEELKNKNQYSENKRKRSKCEVLFVIKILFYNIRRLCCNVDI